MIPKKIHYCWFGGNPKPKLAQKCIKSWKKYCPDYEIIEWNEDNYDISAAPLYVRQAYEAKKWAFVTDYVRLQLIYENGGIYFDTDVQIIHKIDGFLSNKAYFGMENDRYVNTGLGFGAEKGSPVLKRMMDDYRDIAFVLEDGSFDDTPCPKRNSHVFSEYGAALDNTVEHFDDFTLFPSDYFCPLDWDTKKLDKTRNTYTIHWYSASWWDEKKQELHKSYQKKKKIDAFIHFPNKMLIRIMGNEKYDKLKKLFGRK